MPLRKREKDVGRPGALLPLCKPIYVSCKWSLTVKSFGRADFAGGRKQSAPERRRGASALGQVLPDDSAENAQDREQPDHRHGEGADVRVRKSGYVAFGGTLNGEENAKREEEKVARVPPETQEKERGDERAGADDTQQEGVENRVADGSDLIDRRHWLSQMRP